MKLNYKVIIEKPETHLVNVQVNVEYKGQKQIEIFLPCWSPGSYLMREYAKDIRTMRILSQNGEYLNFVQTTKNTWLIDFESTELKKECTSFLIDYQVYCHELTVRTSHVDESHAFLHGPSYLIGFDGVNSEVKIEFKFPALWSKIHTGLKEISEKRDEFIFYAPTYDDLIDCPVEIGCHESDGFMFDQKEHYLVWYGEDFGVGKNLKKDIEKIVDTVASHFSSVPYENYTFITHFKKNLYGGLEHKNSTALQFDPRKLSNREDYINWLALVAHEYFHTWNVKRIRPIELGPFNYSKENYTTMHWLTEGLTSFMDEVFVLRSGLCSIEEYLAMQTKNLQRYFSIPGKKFHSLEQSSFNAWVKLYRPDENSNNSSISYYLKGGLVFSTLHFELKKIGKSINDLLGILWDRYLKNPEVGVTKDEVLEMIESISNKSLKDLFDQRISTGEDIDFETYYNELGMEFVWSQDKKVGLGCSFKYVGENVFIEKVELDSAAYQSGLNAGDEILAINNIRLNTTDIESLHKILEVNKNYNFLVSRVGELKSLNVIPSFEPKKLMAIKVVDTVKAMKGFM